MRTLAILYSKYPYSGRVKTRLTSTMGEEIARCVYARTLRHTHEAFTIAKRRDVSLCVYYEGADNIKNYLRGADFYIKQDDMPLAGRMRRASEFAFDNGYEAVTHSCTDSIMLTHDMLNKVRELQPKYDVVIIPSTDGGYNVISFKSRRFCAALFDGMEFSNRSVLLNTVTRLTQSGVTFKVMEPVPDIDTEDDLRLSRRSSPVALTVIIPVFNDSENLAICIRHLKEVIDVRHEILVVDGGSDDSAATIREMLPDVVFLKSPKGRAIQMNTGARAAFGRWLWFVHADTFVNRKSYAALKRLISGTKSGWGFFDHEIRGARGLLRLIRSLNYLRARYWYRPFGDQAMFVSSGLFEKVGMFDNAPFMEDLLLSIKLRKHSAPIAVKDRVTISDRHWKRLGTFKTTERNWSVLHRLYFMKKSPASLLKCYSNGHS